MSQYIFHEDFLLHSEAAKRLYHGYAKDLPVIDYHNHLPPNEIAENKKYKNLTDIWLKGDHYKWRAMRTLGVNEAFITGNKTDEEKFHAWSACVPKLLRNPLFHWTHLELKNPFSIKEYLNESTAASIYQRAGELLQTDDYSTRALLKHYKVEYACTTDDPIDDLSDHKKIKQDNVFTRVAPGFRPDKAFAIHDKEHFVAYIQQLSEAADVQIKDFDTLLEALKNRIDYFHAAGCTVADHGLPAMPASVSLSDEKKKEFANFLESDTIKFFSDNEAYKGALLTELCKMYHAKGWIQQFHLGPLRNNSTRQFKKLGPDTGFDSIGDQAQAQNLSLCLNELDKTNQLAKTVIYNLNPTYNEVVAAMAGNFMDGTIKGKIQFGSAWWFLDQIDGMTKQINTLSSLGVISTFIGMLTDSRSFLSFPRHEYFRRLLCNIFGSEMEKGLLPNDEKWIGNIVADICYHNVVSFLNLKDNNHQI